MEQIPTSGITHVDAMERINFTGNIIPKMWFKTIVDPESKRPNLYAINILAEICYWYRPRRERDEFGQEVWTKKFKDDKLRISYQTFMNQFDVSKRTIQRAFDVLVKLGAITKEIRQVTLYHDDTKTVEVVYVDVNPQVIYELTYPRKNKPQDVKPILKTKEDLPTSESKVTPNNAQAESEIDEHSCNSSDTNVVSQNSNQLPEQDVCAGKVGVTNLSYPHVKSVTIQRILPKNTSLASLAPQSPRRQTGVSQNETSCQASPNGVQPEPQAQPQTTPGQQQAEQAFLDRQQEDVAFQAFLKAGSAPTSPNRIEETRAAFEQVKKTYALSGRDLVELLHHYNETPALWKDDPALRIVFPVAWLNFPNGFARTYSHVKAQKQLEFGTKNNPSQPSCGKSQTPRDVAYSVQVARETSGAAPHAWMYKNPKTKLFEYIPNSSGLASEHEARAALLELFEEQQECVYA